MAAWTTSQSHRKQTGEFSKESLKCLTAGLKVEGKYLGIIMSSKLLAGIVSKDLITCWPRKNRGENTKSTEMLATEATRLFPVGLFTNHNSFAPHEFALFRHEYFCVLMYCSLQRLPVSLLALYDQMLAYSELGELCKRSPHYSLYTTRSNFYYLYPYWSLLQTLLTKQDATTTHPCMNKLCLLCLLIKSYSFIFCSMPYAQAHYPFENKKEFEASFPADFIAEGIDQTRGW